MQRKQHEVEVSYVFYLSVLGDQQPCCAQRWIVAYMGLFFGMLQYLLSANMSVGIVCMVKVPGTNHLTNTTSDYQINVTHIADHLSRNSSENMQFHQSLDLFATNRTKAYTNGDYTKQLNTTTFNNNKVDEHINDKHIVTDGKRTQSAQVIYNNDVDDTDELPDIPETFIINNQGFIDNPDGNTGVVETESTCKVNTGKDVTSLVRERGNV